MPYVLTWGHDGLLGEIDTNCKLQQCNKLSSELENKATKCLYIRRKCCHHVVGWISTTECITRVPGVLSLIYL